ncbi:MAG: mechanosensitive ion channel [Hyphomonadaceae bacterium]|nr:mechanosensitive ion channel [Hyphomonadaceae bacterium]
MIARFVTLSETAPAWLQAAWPALAALVDVTLVGGGLWLASWLAKRAIKTIGRLRMGKEEVFEGSAWDLGGSLIQFFVLLLGIPLILSIIGLDIGPFLERNAVGMVGAFLILGAGIALARWLSVSIRSFGERARRNQNTDETLFHFAASLGRYVVIALSAIFALQMVGFQPGTLIAVVGAAGLAIALALQDTLRAVAAGVLLAVFRPFRIGDWVLIANAEGEVADITPFHTTIIPVDNRAVVIPNDKAWSEAITNYSRYSERRLNLFFDVSYEDDLERALVVLRETIAALPRCRRSQDVWVGVHEMTANSVTLRVRPWVGRQEVLDFRSDCIMAVKTAFEAAGITIPLPQQVEYTRPYAEIDVRKASPQLEDDPVS